MVNKLYKAVNIMVNKLYKAVNIMVNKLDRWMLKTDARTFFTILIVCYGSAIGIAYFVSKVIT